MADQISQRGGRAAPPRLEEVYDVAARLFFENGYESTSVQSIADELGLLKGSIYYYISSKEDLLFVIVERAHASLLDKLASAGTISEPVARLRAAIKGHVENVAQNIVPVSIFFNDFRSLSGPHRATILNERRSYEGRIRDLIGEAQEAGAFPADLDLNLATKAVLGMTNWVYKWYKEGGDVSPAELGDLFAGFVFFGLSGGKDPALP
jgi:TetR/AcrR family transcriptional regulator, cholesterol catabolism regulator